MSHYFVVPDLSGPMSGGTLYNRELISALDQLGARVHVLELAAAHKLMASGVVQERCYWLDSLYLDDLPELAQTGNRVGLIAHYLPALVRYGAGVAVEQLSESERKALAAARAFIAPSAFMKTIIERLCLAASPICILEPGSNTSLVGSLSADTGVRAALVGNVVPGKQTFEFLDALREERHEHASFTLAVIGSLTSDPAYAARCLELVQASSFLSAHVTFAGVLTQAELFGQLAERNLFVSASRMEAYGMALAEARTMGLPILACEGGNVSSHISAQAGGRLLNDVCELAREFMHLSRSPAEHAKRLLLAKQHAPAARSWSTVAQEFLDNFREACD